jgi:hypothetical protein
LEDADLQIMGGSCALRFVTLLLWMQAPELDMIQERLHQLGLTTARQTVNEAGIMVTQVRKLRVRF